MYILPEDGHRSGPKHVVSSAQQNRAQKHCCVRWFEKSISVNVETTEISLM
jgi:hypothetical protein